jgi:hypothetical protein
LASNISSGDRSPGKDEGMTFKETDFPSLVRFLKTFVTEDSDPILVKDVVLKMIKLYEDVPLYPGIVNMCLGGLVKNVPAREVVDGQKVFVRSGEDLFCGTVVQKDDDGVVLRGVKSVTSEDEIDLGYKEMQTVRVVNDKVLEEMWPSLVFPKEARK